MAGDATTTLGKAFDGDVNDVLGLHGSFLAGHSDRVPVTGGMRGARDACPRCQAGFCARFEKGTFVVTTTEVPEPTGDAPAGLAIVAFGGNALQGAGERGTVDEMRANLRAALAGLEPLLRSGAPLCITHGNGPQVGNALLRSEAAVAEVPPHPLDIAVATTQAEIGSLVATELEAVLAEWNAPRAVAVIVTHVEIAADDPAMRQPSKPVGPFYSDAEARSLERGRGWVLIEDSGRGWRRVVGSPQPQHIVEIESIRALLARGTIVVAAGGGGIPVARHDDQGRKRLVGVEAVIDKDRTAALLARELGADQLIILTAVDSLYTDFGTERQQAVGTLTVAAARELLATGVLPAGSMAPKVEAGAAFAESSGHCALITSESALAAALAGTAGTRITP